MNFPAFPSKKKQFVLWYRKYFIISPLNQDLHQIIMTRHPNIGIGFHFV